MNAERFDQWTIELALGIRTDQDQVSTAQLERPRGSFLLESRRQTLMGLAIAVGAVIARPLTSLAAKVPKGAQRSAGLSAAKTCDSVAYQACMNEVQTEEDRCKESCLPYCSQEEIDTRQCATGNIQCCGCLRSHDCTAIFSGQASACYRLYGCPTDMACQTDPAPPRSQICCLLSQANCQGNCVSAFCEAPLRFDEATCSCKCSILCNPPREVSANCTCDCPGPNCNGGKIRDQNCACVCPGTLVACPDGNCRDLRSDPNNCGACGTICGAGKSCCNGECVTLGTAQNCSRCSDACSTGKTCCNGRCVDLQVDPQNCGQCGFSCIQGAKCCNRTCCGSIYHECRNNTCICTGPTCDGPDGQFCCPSGFYCPVGGTADCCRVPNSVACAPLGFCCSPPTLVCCPPIPTYPEGYCCSAGQQCCPTGCC